LWPHQAADAGADQGQLDPQMIVTHGQVVEDLPRLMPTDAARKFATLVDPSTTPANSGYVTAWKWMELLLEHQQRVNRSSFSSSSTTMDPVDQAIATVRHLSRQFRVRVEQNVHNVVMAGQNDLLQDTIIRLPKTVKLIPYCSWVRLRNNHRGLCCTIACAVEMVRMQHWKCGKFQNHKRVYPIP
jgi:hypothetical protein